MELPRLKIGNKRNDYMPAYITERHTHILVLGKSGSGKSTCISNWWQQDNFYRNAKILIDPAGFLARDAFSISGGKYCSLETPISLNPMKAPYTDGQISGLIAEAVNQVIVVTTPNQELTAKMREILDLAVRYCLKNNRRSLVNVRDYIINFKGSSETKDGILARLNFILNDERMLRIIC